MITRLYLVTLNQPENTNLRGRITVQLTSCLFCFDSAALFSLISKKFTCLVKSKPVKQKVSCTVIRPPIVTFLWFNLHTNRRAHTAKRHKRYNATPPTLDRWRGPTFKSRRHLRRKSKSARRPRSGSGSSLLGRGPRPRLWRSKTRLLRKTSRLTLLVLVWSPTLRGWELKN